MNVILTISRDVKRSIIIDVFENGATEKAEGN